MGRLRGSETSKDSGTGNGIPPGAPCWVTSELIQETIKIWQPYYVESLTDSDALDMIVSVGRLLDVLEPAR